MNMKQRIEEKINIFFYLSYFMQGKEKLCNVRGCTASSLASGAVIPEVTTHQQCKAG